MTKTKAVVGFQIVTLEEGLYLSRAQRTGWRSSVVFVEPPGLPGKMTVLSVVVAQGTDPLNLHAQRDPTSLISIQPLGLDRTVQLVASYAEDASVRGLVHAAVERTLKLWPVDMPRAGVLSFHGGGKNGPAWFAALPYSDFTTD